MADNDNNDGKATNLVDRLLALSAEQQAFDARMDRLRAGLRMTVDAVTRMRREVPGITPDEVARSFEIAAEEIRAGEGEGWSD